MRELDFTGSDHRRSRHPAPPVIFGIPINNNGFFFWFVAPFVIVGMTLALNLTKSRAGRALSAINDWELAAESLGVSTYALRLKVFVLSAAFAGIGGVFYAYQVAIVSPETAGFEVSVELLLMVVIGGLGSVWGALAGAFLITLLGDGMRDLIPAIIPGATGEVQLLGYGIVLILAILLLPGGLHQAAVALWRLMAPRTRRTATSAGEEDVGEIPLPTISTPLAAGEPILTV